MSSAESQKSSVDRAKKIAEYPILWGDPHLAMQITYELWRPWIQMQSMFLAQTNHFFGSRAGTPLDKSIPGSRIEDYFPRSK